MRSGRGLGLHRSGADVAYVLVERRPEQPPEVLAAGRCRVEELPGLHARLAAGRPLPWALAEEQGGRTAPGPAGDWPLRRPEARAVLHPAVAAASWEWERGRVGPEDLFLWLRAERLLWARGEPGSGCHGQVARTGPLRELLAGLLQAVGAPGAPAVLAVDGDAPGGSVLREAVAGAGHPVRISQALPEERGADRAAAGAALAALDPRRPGARPPRRRRALDPWVAVPSLLAATGLGWALALERTLPPAPGAPGPPAPAAPAELGRILARRRAVALVLESILGAAPPGSIEELEVQAAPGEGFPEIRLRLLPGGDPSWASRLAGARRLTRRRLADGSTLLRGPWAAPEEPGPGGGG